MTKHVTLNGIRFMVTDDFNEDDPTEMQALAELAEYVIAHPLDITPEQEQRQAESRARIHARNIEIRRHKQ